MQTRDLYAIQVEGAGGYKMILYSGYGETSCTKYITEQNWMQEQSNPRTWVYSCIKLPKEIRDVN